MWALDFGWKNLKPSMFRKHSEFDTPWAPIKQTPFSTRSNMFNIGSADLRGVLKACREHQTTITGLLMALVVASLATQSRKDGRINGAPFEGVSAHTAMDLRRHLPKKHEKYPWIVPDELLSNIVSVTIHEFEADLVTSIREAAKSAPSDEQILARIDEPMWKLAARTRRELEERLAAGLHNEVNTMMNIIPDWRAEHKHHLAGQRLGGIVLTNLGVMDGGDKDDTSSWAIESAMFQLSPEMAGLPIGISAISVKGGDLCVDISWQESVLPESVMGQLSSDVESWMRALGQAQA